MDMMLILFWPVDRALAVQNPILAAQAAASLSGRKDACHGETYAGKGSAKGDYDADV
jgi:hypothetical protein